MQPEDNIDLEGLEKFAKEFKRRRIELGTTVIITIIRVGYLRRRTSAMPPPSPPVDIILAMMIVWRIKVEIIRTVLCCVVYNSCAPTTNIILATYN